jgi:hypothetical protein
MNGRQSENDIHSFRYDGDHFYASDGFSGDAFQVRDIRGRVLFHAGRDVPEIDGPAKVKRFNSTTAEGNMRLWKSIIVGLAVVALSTVAQAQTPASGVKSDLKKLDVMIGEWKGGGWVEYAPGQRRAFTGTETVESKLGGKVIEVEGLHMAARPGSDKEEVIHNALGILSWDEGAKLYRFHAWVATGHHTAAEVKLIESGWQWGYADPRGVTVRFTIKITEKGEWHEIGEASPDGKTWRQFFEMNMRKVK